MLQKGTVNLGQSVLPVLHSCLCPKLFLKWEHFFPETWQGSTPCWVVPKIALGSPKMGFFIYLVKKWSFVFSTDENSHYFCILLDKSHVWEKSCSWVIIWYALNHLDCRIQWLAIVPILLRELCCYWKLYVLKGAIKAAAPFKVLWCWSAMLLKKVIFKVAILLWHYTVKGAVLLKTPCH